MMYDTPKVYAIKHKDLNIRMESRSGGIFTALSDPILEQGGAVYGCVLNEEFEAVHIRAVTKAQRDRMRGSKYVQSRMENCFRQVREDLEQNRPVLFSGTSCQIAGLRAFLKKDYENLLTVDIVCHGVPSPLVWQKYLRWMEKTHKGTVTAVDFRNKKKYGWESHVETITIQKNGCEEQVDSGVFTTMFVDHAALRPGCYTCPYKDVHHPGDITIADYWGIDQAAPGFSDNRGVSLVLVNNDRGDAALAAVLDSVDWQRTRLEDSMQPPLRAPFPAPANRSQFWQDFAQRDFGYMAKVYGGTGLKTRMKVSLVRTKRRLVEMIKGGKNAN